MSRKISIQEKKKWLEMFELGKTENQIAREVKRDLRTIVNGLQEASRDRHLANAESEMLRKALFNHQDKLINLLTSISNMLVLPPSNMVLREDENGLLLPEPLPGLLIEQTTEKQINLRIHDEDKLEWELLVEHLKADKLWGYIKKWRPTLAEHIYARCQFKKEIKSSLENETGLKFRGKSGDQPEYLLPAIVDLLYGVTTNRILGIKDGSDLEHNILTDEKGFIRYGSELARCKDAAKCRDKIMSVIGALPNTSTAIAVKNTFSDLTAITKSARRQVDEILLLGMVTGKCRVCTRLGR